MQYWLSVYVLKWFQKLAAWNNRHLLSWFLGVRKLGTALVGTCASPPLTKLQSRGLQSHMKTWLWMDLLSGSLVWLLEGFHVLWAVGLRALVPAFLLPGTAITSLPCGSFHRKAGFYCSKRERIRSHHKMEVTVILQPDLLTCHPCYCTLFIINESWGSAHIQRRDYPRTWIPRGRDHWGPF